MKPSPDMKPSPAREPSARREILLAAAAALVVFAASLGLRRQGLDLLEDGQWLLSAWVLERGGHLYREIFTRQGPLDAHLLRTLFAVAGTKAASLALLKAAVDGLAAGALLAGTRRLGAGRWAWLAPLGVLALGPFPPRFTLVLVAAVILVVAKRRGGIVLAGLLAGLGALGGVDSLALVLLLVIFAPRPSRSWLFRGAVALPLLVALAAGLAQGTLPAAVDQVVGGWTARLGDQLERVPPTRLVHTLVSAEAAPSPFTLLKTGETLDPILPGAAILHAWSWRLRLLMLAVVGIWAWRRRARWGGPAQALMVMTLAPWMGLLLRGDARFVDAAWLGALVFLPPLLAVWGHRPAFGRFALLLLLPVLLWGPALIEDGWLLVHAHRPGLQEWPRSTAGIALSRETIDSLDALFAQLPRNPSQPEEPILVWPASPGLNFLLGAPPAVPQTLLLPERVRHPEALLARLQEAAPRLVLLGLSWDFTGRRIDELAPGCWDHLREHYRVLGNLAQGTVKLRILQRLAGEESAEQLPLPQRLPDVEQTVANGASPALRHDFEVGQSLLVGDRDLEGFAVRWRTKAKDVTVPLRIRIWMQRRQGWDSLAEQYDVDVKIPGDLHRSYIHFPTVAESAHHMVAITFETREDLDFDVRLLWHRHGLTDAPIDFYPEGTALVEMEPVQADLYFMSW